MQSWASFTEGRKNIFVEPLLQERMKQNLAVFDFEIS